MRKPLIGLGCVAVLALTGCTSATRAGTGPSCAAACVSEAGATGPTSPDPSIPSPLLAWYSAVSRDLSAVRSDQYDIATASDDQDAALLTMGCSSLQTDVLTMEDNESAPDPTVRNDLTAALLAYGQAATSCLNGDFVTASSDIEDAATELDRVVTRITASVAEAGSGRSARLRRTQVGRTGTDTR